LSEAKFGCFTMQGMGGLERLNESAWQYAKCHQIGTKGKRCDSLGLMPENMAILANDSDGNK